MPPALVPCRDILGEVHLVAAHDGELRRCGNGDDVVSAEYVPVADLDRRGVDHSIRTTLAHLPALPAVDAH